MNMIADFCSGDMLRFHRCILFRYENVRLIPRHQFTWHEFTLTGLTLDSQYSSAPFLVDFESTIQTWELWPRMYVEPDGSFVWVGESSAGSWQIDGNLYDRNDKLWYIELQGTITAKDWSALLDSLQLKATEAVLSFAYNGEIVALADWLAVDWSRHKMNTTEAWPVYQGYTTPQSVTLDLKLPTLITSSDIIQAQVVGPFCEFANTLSAKIKFKPDRETKKFSARVPDPCFWTANLPFLYRVNIEYRDTAGVIQSATKTIGLRRQEWRGPSLFIDGQRTVWRAIEWSAAWGEPAWTELRNTRTSLIAKSLDIPRFSQANRYGVPLLWLPQQNGTPSFTGSLLQEQPAISLIPDDLYQEPFPQQLLTGQIGYQDMRLATASIITEAELQAQPTLLNQLRPCLVLRTGSTATTWEERRRECDALQAATAAYGDCAGYLICE
jgi:hypothetical protein